MDSILRLARSTRAAISCPPRVVVYRDIVRAAQSVSFGLRENFPEAWRGCTGPRVGLLASPSAEFVSAMLGIWLSGGIAVPLGASLPLPEKSYMLKDAGVTTLLATRKTLACMRPLERDVSVGAHKCTLLLPDIIKKAHGHHALGNHGRHGEDTPDFSYPPLGEDVEESWMPTYFGGGAGEGSLLLYTSGTTGRPKGVLHTHGSILAQIRAMETCWEWRQSDRVLHCLPLHHILPMDL